MTLIEIVVVLGLLVGVAVGAAVGFGAAGILGGAVGAVLGAVLGVGGGGGLLGAGFGLAIMRERWVKRRGLSPTFGRYWSRDHASAWEDVKERLTGGEIVRGNCVLEVNYGRFLDIGFGFPALLKKSEDPATVPLTSDRELEGWVLDFDDADHEIVLTRRDHRWLMYEGIPVGHLLDNKLFLEHGEVHYFAITNRMHSRFRERLRQEGTIRCQLSSTDGLAPTCIELRDGEQRERGGHARLRLLLIAEHSELKALNGEHDERTTSETSR
jgi:hypothetical protein